MCLAVRLARVVIHTWMKPVIETKQFAGNDGDCVDIDCGGDSREE